MKNKLKDLMINNYLQKVAGIGFQLKVIKNQHLVGIWGQIHFIVPNF